MLVWARGVRQRRRLGRGASIGREWFSQPVEPVDNPDGTIADQPEQPKVRVELIGISSRWTPLPEGSMAAKRFDEHVENNLLSGRRRRVALAIQRRFTRAGESPYAAIAFRLASSEIRSPDGSVVFRLDQLEAPSSWSQVAIDVLAQKYFRKAGDTGARLRPCVRRACRLGCAGASPIRPRWPSCPRPSATAARPARSRCSIGWQEPGPIGAGKAATSPTRRTPAPSSTSCATCWRRRWRRRTRRSGSTPACTGPTASTARRRATSMSTSRPARFTPRPRPTSGRSRTPASSRASRTIS